MEPRLEKEIASLQHNHDAFYLVDILKLNKELIYLRQCFDKYPTDVSYSYKTNYLKPIIKFLDNKKVFSEIVSSFELDIASNYSIDISKIIYNGPVKSQDSILRVLANGGLVNADSLDDLEMICSLVLENGNLNFKRIGIRICLDEKNLDSRFGISENQNSISKALGLINKVGLDYFACVHIHYADRSLEEFKKKLESFFIFLQQHKNIFSKETIFDIGGALPSVMPEEVLSSLGKEKNEDISLYGDFLSKLREKYGMENYKFLLEPGTFLCANCVSLVGNIKAINTTSNYININTDISKTLLGGLKQNIFFPLEFIFKKVPLKNKENEKKIRLSGFTCVESDNWEIEIKNIPSVGDKLILNSVGSYSCVFKSPFIRGDIAVFQWDGKKLIQVRNAQSASDITKLDIL